MTSAASVSPAGSVGDNRPYLGAVPDCEPAFDDEMCPPRTARLRAETAWSRPGIGHPVTDRTVPGWSREPDVGIACTPAASLPGAATTAGVLARALIEAMTGFRQVGQLRAHCAPEVFAGLERRVKSGGALPKLLSVRASEPADGVAEATAVFRRADRVAALAFRMQGVDGRWRVTALQVG
jgi:hypothetical protein